MAEQAIQRRWMPMITIGIVLIAAGLIGSTIARALAQPSIQETVASTEVGFVANGDAELDESFDESEPTSVQSPPHDDQPLPEMVVVYISGAVANPDTYQLVSDARINDVVQLAGGLTEEAARDQINLAERIRDEQHIHIPRSGEVSATAASDAQPATGNGLLNINSADAPELEALDGIGQVLAQRIVEWRDNDGPFKSIEDLQQIKGITASVYNKIKDDITVQ